MAPRNPGGNKRNNNNRGGNRGGGNRGRNKNPFNVERGNPNKWRGKPKGKAPGVTAPKKSTAAQKRIDRQKAIAKARKRLQRVKQNIPNREREPQTAKLKNARNQLRTAKNKGIKSNRNLIPKQNAVAKAGAFTRTNKRGKQVVVAPTQAVNKQGNLKKGYTYNSGKSTNQGDIARIQSSGLNRQQQQKIINSRPVATNFGKSIGRNDITRMQQAGMTSMGIAAQIRANPQAASSKAGRRALAISEGQFKKGKYDHGDVFNKQDVQRMKDKGYTRQDIAEYVNANEINNKISKRFQLRSNADGLPPSDANTPSTQLDSNADLQPNPNPNPQPNPTTELDPNPQPNPTPQLGSTPQLDPSPSPDESNTELPSLADLLEGATSDDLADLGLQTIPTIDQGTEDTDIAPPSTEANDPMANYEIGIEPAPTPAPAPAPTPSSTNNLGDRESLVNDITNNVLAGLNSDKTKKDKAQDFLNGKMETLDGGMSDRSEKTETPTLSETPREEYKTIDSYEPSKMYTNQLQVATDFDNSGSPKIQPVNPFTGLAYTLDSSTGMTANPLQEMYSTIPGQLTSQGTIKGGYQPYVPNIPDLKPPTVNDVTVPTIPTPTQSPYQTQFEKDGMGYLPGQAGSKSKTDKYKFGSRYDNLVGTYDFINN